MKTPNAPERNEIRRSLEGNSADSPGHEGLLTRAAPRQRALPALTAAAAACAAVSLNSKSNALPKNEQKGPTYKKLKIFSKRGQLDSRVARVKCCTAMFNCKKRLRCGREKALQSCRGLIKDAFRPGLWPNQPKNPTHQQKLTQTVCNFNQIMQQGQQNKFKEVARKTLR